jgi:tetratricopeptide (TPR) repeat protein
LSRLKQNQPKPALEDFLAAADYPENLSVGRSRSDALGAQVAYCAGQACEAMGDAEKAKEYYTKAASQRGGGFMTESRFYRAMAMKKLDRASEAQGIFDDLIKTGKDRLARDEAADFFAKFGERESPQARRPPHYSSAWATWARATPARLHASPRPPSSTSATWARQLLKTIDYRAFLLQHLLEGEWMAEWPELSCSVTP